MTCALLNVLHTETNSSRLYSLNIGMAAASRRMPALCNWRFKLAADEHSCHPSLDAVHLKYRLRNVKTDRCDRLHDWLLQIVGALTAPTILGTHVPVEEPVHSSINSGHSPRTKSICSKVAVRSADPAGVPEAIVGQATLGIGGEVRLDAIRKSTGSGTSLYAEWPSKPAGCAWIAPNDVCFGSLADIATIAELVCFVPGAEVCAAPIFRQPCRRVYRYQRLEPSPAHPRMLLGLWRAECLHRLLLPRSHPEERESLKTQRTRWGPAHRRAIPQPSARASPRLQKNVAADVRAACTGRAVVISEIPSSSRAWAVKASFAISW